MTRVAMRIATFRKVLVVVLILACRNLWRHPRRTLITASTITIGLVMAIFFIGIGDGSHHAMVRQSIALGQGHITVQPAAYFSAPHNQLLLPDGLALKRILSAAVSSATIAPRIELQALASTAYQSEGVQVMGVTPEDPFLKELTRHQPIGGDPIDSADAQGVWLGTALAHRLQVTLGGKVVMMAGRQGDDALSHLVRVRGIFQTGITELDRYMMVSSLTATHPLLADPAEDAQGSATRLAIFLPSDADLALAQEKIESLVTATGMQDTDGVSAVVMPWQEMMPDLVQFIAVDDAGNYVFLSLIMVLIVFGVVNTVLMSVLERTREFGLMVALGLSPGFVWLLVIAEALLLAGFASAIGWCLGGLVYAWFATQGLDLSGLIDSSTQVMGTVMDPIIYAHLSWARVGQLTSIVVGMTLLSGLYPAVKAARVSPLEAMRR